jgi:cytochrome d ubiquinol oxidase subunit I
MQNPVGMVFNPETARNEMVSFWQVLFNPVAVDKFLHTITSGFLLGSMFVLSISAWYFLKGREEWLAERSILIAGVFGLFSSLLVVYTGDTSTRTLAQVQPVKFAAFEALYEGKQDAGLVAVGFLKESEKTIRTHNEKDFVFRVEIPGLLSVMTGGSRDIWVPGIRDLIEGNPAKGMLSVSEKMSKGTLAKDLLIDYRNARLNNDTEQVETLQGIFREQNFHDDYFRYFGYASLQRPEEAIPNIPVSFYSFHLMVMLGFFFILLFTLALFFLFRGKLKSRRWFLWIALFSLPLPYIASELGWVVAEMGRQPWVIQDLMPVTTAVTNISAGAVKTTFVMFAVLFTVLLFAEISIMIRQIKIGPKH